MFTLLTEIDLSLRHRLEEISLFRKRWQQIKEDFPNAGLIYSTEKRLSHFLQSPSTSRLPAPDYIMTEMSDTPVLYKRIVIAEDESSEVKYKFIRVHLPSQEYSTNTGHCINWLRNRIFSNENKRYPLLTYGMAKYNYAILKYSSDYAIIPENAHPSLTKFMNSSRFYKSQKTSFPALIDGLEHFNSVVKTNSYEIH